jgi:hypothetical protein
MCLSPPYLRTETDPVSERRVFYSLEYRTMEKVQKPSNSIMSCPTLEVTQLPIQWVAGAVRE